MDKKPLHLRDPGEVDLLRRLKEMSRHAKYDPDEANDIAKAAANAASDYLLDKAPDADILLVTCVPFSSERNGVKSIGNAMVQNIRGGRLFGESMKQDVIPQLGRFFSDNWRDRLMICWKIMFGSNPEDYDKRDR